MAERRDQIRTAALAAFHRKGYHGTALREIASEVGIQAPSLYNHFDSKQDLLFEVMVDVMHELIRRVRTAVARVDGRAADKLAAGLRAFITYNTLHPHEASVSDTCFPALDEDKRRAIIELRDEFDAVFEKLILEGVEQGDFAVDDVGVAKETMLSACARVYFWHRPGGRLNDDELAHVMSNYLINGLRQIADSQG